MCLCLPCLLMCVPVYLFSLVWACVPCLLFVQECSMSPSLHVYHVSVSISVWCLLVCEHEYHDSRVCTCVSCLLVVVLVYQVSVYVHVYHVSVFLCLRLVKHKIRDCLRNSTFRCLTISETFESICSGRGKKKCFHCLRNVGDSENNG